MFVSIDDLYSILVKEMQSINNIIMKLNLDLKKVIMVDMNLKALVSKKVGDNFKFLNINCGLCGNLINFKNIYKNADFYGITFEKDLYEVFKRASKDENNIIYENCINIFDGYEFEYPKFDYVYITSCNKESYTEDLNFATHSLKPNGKLIIDKEIYDKEKEFIEKEFLKENKKYELLQIEDKLLIESIQEDVNIKIKTFDLLERKSENFRLNIYEKLDSKKIAFIFCVNDEEKFNKSLSYIKSLSNISSIEIEVIKILNAKSITSGYNFAMEMTNAKYKVYLHQDVYIIHKDFIKQIIDTFENNKNLGILGCVGSETLPLTAIWWEGLNFGKVFDSRRENLKLLEFNSFTGDYKKVSALDGLILITSEDVFWREDIFDGWHFYDISQCFEFRKRGLEAGIINQISPWIVHDCGVVNIDEFDKYRNCFIGEYLYDDTFKNKKSPLVSVLIPAYNETEYFKRALESALNQTYKNIEIIICDDSTNDDIKNATKEYLDKYKNIKYINNGGPLGKMGALNLTKCFNLSSGEYINFLMQDDLFAPNKIEEMLKYIVSNPNIKLVTSYRKIINSNGDIQDDLKVTEPFIKTTSIINGEYLGSYMLNTMQNVIGEFTTALFKKSDLEGELLNYNGYKARCNGDVLCWLKLLKKGDVVYISEPLSFFRLHEKQNTFNSSLQAFGSIDWYNLIKNSFEEESYVKNEFNFRNLMKLWFNNNLNKITCEENFWDKNDKYTVEAKNKLEECYSECIKYLLKIKD